MTSPTPSPMSPQLPGPAPRATTMYDRVVVVTHTRLCMLQVLSVASSMPLDRPSGTYGGGTDAQLGQQPSGSSPGGIVAVTAAACNTVWVGCDNGLLEQYTSFGRLLNSVGRLF